VKIVQWLLEHSVSVNSRDNRGRTPLHVILQRSDGVTLLLLEYGTDPGIWDNDGKTPLHAAS